MDKKTGLDVEASEQAACLLCGSSVTACVCERRLCCLTACKPLQAAAWLGWEHAVSSSRTSSLQFWNGTQWQQTEFPSPDKLRKSLPLATTPPAQAGAPPAAPDNQPKGSASPSNGAGAGASSSVEEAAQPAPMSGFTAQAMLECHYSHHGAFLQEPLLQVRHHITSHHITSHHITSHHITCLPCDTPLSRSWRSQLNLCT